jgi:antirestriction protein
MLDNTTNPQIYVACLAAYNSGILHGRWIDATSDVDAMQEDIAAMLAASPVPDAEEWAIHDYDSFPNLGEYPGLEAVAATAELFEDFDHIDAGDLQAIIHNFRDPAEARTELDDNFCGIFDSFRDYADEAADEEIACHISDGKLPQMLINYFDYEAWARDLALEMTVIDCPSGVAVFHS